MSRLTFSKPCSGWSIQRTTSPAQHQRAGIPKLSFLHYFFYPLALNMVHLDAFKRRKASMKNREVRRANRKDGTHAEQKKSSLQLPRSAELSTLQQEPIRAVITQLMSPQKLQISLLLLPLYGSDPATSSTHTFLFSPKLPQYLSILQRGVIPPGDPTGPGGCEPSFQPYNLWKTTNPYPSGPPDSTSLSRSSPLINT